MAYLSHFCTRKNRSNLSPNPLILIETKTPAASASGTRQAPYKVIVATLVAGSFLTLFVATLPLTVGAFWPFVDARAEGDSTPILHNPEEADLLAAALNSDPNPDKSAPELEMTSGSALLPSGSPDGTLPPSNGGGSGAISLYQVREGDSLSQIADMFGVTVNTILWANDIKDAKTIQPGDTLLILPVSGVQHKVLKGETLAGIAKKYDADADEIALYNGVESAVAGETLIIPGGGLNHDHEEPKVVAKKSSATTSAAKRAPLPALTGYFGNPLPGAYVSQGIHGNNGVDLAGMPKGSSVIAAAAGSVIVAKNDGGYNGGYGNYVVVSHDNGTQTLYAHLSSVSVSVGQTVSKGDVLGGVGNTGRSTGIHLHFEVRGAKNPFAN